MGTSDILVVLPTLGDRLDTLRETLNSIHEESQEVDLRLIVVCPSEAHYAQALAKEYGATIVDDPKRGISHAINAGIRARDGETYYAWMGDDDLFRPQGLKILRSLLEMNPQAVVSFGGCDYITPDGKIIATSKAGRLAQFLLPWGPNLIPHPGSMIRLDAIESVGLFDEKLKYVMDLDMFLRLRPEGDFVSTRKSVSAFRWHPESLTVANRQSSSAEAEAVKNIHLPTFLRVLSPLWHVPIRGASACAAKNLNKRASKITGGSV